MKKNIFYVVNFFWLSLASSLLFYLLVLDTSLHLSISDILDWASHCTKHGHLMVIGLLPIYLGMIIFGAAVFFVYLRSNFWPLISQTLRHWLHIERKS